MATKATAAAEVAERKASLEAGQNTLRTVKRIPLTQVLSRG